MDYDDAEPPEIEVVTRCWDVEFAEDVVIADLRLSERATIELPANDWVGYWCPILGAPAGWWTNGEVALRLTEPPPAYATSHAPYPWSAVEARLGLAQEPRPARHAGLLPVLDRYPYPRRWEYVVGEQDFGPPEESEVSELAFHGFSNICPVGTLWLPGRRGERFGLFTAPGCAPRQVQAPYVPLLLADGRRVSFCSPDEPCAALCAHDPQGDLVAVVMPLCPDDVCPASPDFVATAPPGVLGERVARWLRRHYSADAQGVLVHELEAVEGSGSSDGATVTIATLDWVCAHAPGARVWHARLPWSELAAVVVPEDPPEERGWCEQVERLEAVDMRQRRAWLEEESPSGIAPGAGTLMSLLSELSRFTRPGLRACAESENMPGKRWTRPCAGGMR